MIEVHFLGVGAAVPAAGETNCSYLVRAGEVTLLVDCGPAVLQQLAAAGLTPGDVTHLYVSHRHGDHALGYPLFTLWWAMEGKDRAQALPTIIASGVTLPSLRVLWDHAYGELPPPAFPHVELPADACSEHGLPGGVLLKTWPLPHSKFAPVLGLRVEHEGRAVAFTADAAQSPNIVEMAHEADLLVHDSRHSAAAEPDRPDGSSAHCSAAAAGRNARDAGVRRLALVHIGAELADQHASLIAEARASFAGEVTAPRAGDRVELP